MKRALNKRVLRYIEENRLLKRGDTLVVAVSGGADSVALLDILVSLEELRLRLIVAHVNHLLRGPESDADEDFVRELARGYGLPCEVKRVDVRGVALREGRSLEDAGRAERYRFLDEVARARGAAAVALAHHCDDQAETVLMRLLRGTGGSGLCAMAPHAAGRYLRPLLFLTRSEIEGYLARQGIAWRSDSSNDSVDFLRNRIRHELIPFLRSYNPAVSERLAATAEALAADEEVLEAAVSEAFSRICRTDGNAVALLVADTLREPTAIRLRLYRRSILRAKGDLARISFRHLKDIDLLFSSVRPNLSLTLPDGVVVSRSYGRVIISASGEKPAVPHFELLLDAPGDYPLPVGVILSLRLAERPADLGSESPFVEYFDMELAPLPWRVRTFCPGDRFTPLGMSGRKKVKELFIDEKIPVEVRPLVPLIFSGETLIWVGGVRRSNAATLTPDTGNIIRAELLASP